MFKLDPKKVNYQKEFGSGAFGVVYAYQNDNDDDRWVVKRLITRKTVDFIKHIQEIVLGFSFDHPNLIPVKGFSIEHEDETWRTYLKFPRMVRSLKSKISQHESLKEYFSEHEIAKYFYGLTSGLLYLHKKGIVHRDIKPDNILLDKEDQIRIGDIGIGKFVAEEMSDSITDYAGTRSYCAPEIIKEEPNLKKKDLIQADLWSLGVVMVELCLLIPKVTDPSKSGQEMEDKITHLLKEYGGKRYSKVLIDLILGLLRYDRTKRISLQQVLDTLEANYSFLSKEENTSFKDSTLYKELFARRFEHNWINDFKIENDLKKSLKIDVINENITNNHLKRLMEEVAQVQSVNKKKRIEQFEINLEKCAWITNEGVKELAQKIGSNLRNVERLAVSFKTPGFNKNINDDSVKQLAQQIGPNLRKIQQLKLKFDSCSKITDNGVSELALDIGSNMTDLKQLELYFGSSAFSTSIQITDIGLGRLAGQIGSNVKNLQQLILSFECCQIGDTGIRDLAQQVGSLKNIKDITLNFAWCEQITDKGINELSRQIGSRLQSMQHLELSFTGCKKITDNGFNELARQISPNLKNIQRLKLCFDWTEVKEESKESLKKYCNAIPSLTNLEIL